VFLVHLESRTERDAIVTLLISVGFGVLASIRADTRPRLSVWNLWV